MKKIFYDIDAASSTTKSGIGFYSVELLRALSCEKNVKIKAFYFNFLSRNTVALPELPNVEYIACTLVPRKAYNLLRRIGINLPIELLTLNRFDYSIFPNYIYKPSIFTVKSCVVVHDFSYLEHKETVSKKNRKDLDRFVYKSLKKVSFAVCISQTMEKKLHYFYPWFTNKTVVTQIPPTPLPKLSDGVEKNILTKFAINKDYFLFIGTKEPRKNLDKLIKGYLQTSKNFQKNTQLVIAGGNGWNQPLNRTDAHIATKNIIETGYITDLEKHALLVGARALVLPSIYEGYGMPIIEAMSVQTAVIVSKIDVFEEITGGLCTFINPSSESDIAATLEGFTESPDIIEKAFRKTKRMKWSQASRDILTSLEQS